MSSGLVVLPPHGLSTVHSGPRISGAHGLVCVCDWLGQGVGRGNMYVQGEEEI